MTEIKPGRSSTEFLIVSLVTIASLIAAQYSGTVWGEVAGTVVAGGLALGYSANRASVKRVQVAAKVVK